MRSPQRRWANIAVFAAIAEFSPEALFFREGEGGTQVVSRPSLLCARELKFHMGINRVERAHLG